MSSIPHHTAPVRSPPRLWRLLVVVLLALGLASAVTVWAAVNITVTKTDTLLIDNDGDDQADPGDTLRYTVAISNSGDTDALNVVFSDTLDSHTTLVPGSIRVSPLAFDDAYQAIGNTRIVVSSTYGLLANDADPDDPPPNPPLNNGLTVIAFDDASTLGGEVSVSATGAFTYTPPVDQTGITDTFEYTIQDPDGLAAAGTVAIQISDTVWYVDNSAPGGGDGRSSSPLNTLPAAIGGAGDIIFVHETGSGAYNGPVTLGNNQQLIGQGVDLATATGLVAPLGTTFPSPGSNPTLTSGGDAITLGQGNTIRGLTVGDTGGAGIRDWGSSVGTLTVSDVTIEGNGAAVDIANGGTLNVTFDRLASTSATTAVNLNGAGGSFSVSNPGAGTDTDITGASSGIAIQNAVGAATFSFGETRIDSSSTGINLATSGSASFTFDSLDITTSAGAGLVADYSGTVNLGGTANTISTTGGAAVAVRDTSLGSGWTFRSIAGNGAANGIVLDNAGSGGLTVTGDGSLTRNASGGTLQNITGDSISLTNTQNVTLQSIDILDSGAAGIRSTNAGNLTLSAITIQGPANQALNADNLTGVNRIDNDSLITQVNSSGTEGVRVVNTSTNLTSLTLDNSTFSNSTTESPFIFLISRGTSNMTLNVQNGCVFEGLFGEAVQTNAGDTAGSTGTVTSNISNSTFRNAATDGAGGIFLATAQTWSTQGFAISDNSFFNLANGLAGGNIGIITLNTTGGTLAGTVSGNTIGNASGGNGDRRGVSITSAPDLDVNGQTGSIDVTIENNTVDRLPTREVIFVDLQEDTQDSEVTITDNQIGQLSGFEGQVGGTREAVEIRSRGTSVRTFNVLLDSNAIVAATAVEVIDIDSEGFTTLNLTVTNNDMINSGAGEALSVDTEDAGASICLDIRDNDAAGLPTHYNLAHQAGTFRVEGAGTAAVTAGDIEAAQNSGSAAVFGTITYNGGANCSGPVTMWLPTHTGLTRETEEALEIGKFATLPVCTSSTIPPTTPHAVEIARLPHADDFPTALSVTHNAKPDVTPLTGADTPATYVPVYETPRRQTRVPGLLRLLPARLFRPLASGENIQVSIGTLPAGKAITITFEATIDVPAAAGVTQVANQGNVQGEDFTDVPTDDPDTPAPDDPTLTDLDIEVDLGITKDDGQATAIPGDPITYTLVVTNAGPNHVTGATVTDDFPGTLTGVTWTCTAGAGDSCTASGTGDLDDSIDLQAGSAVTYTVSGTIDPSATGTLTNTASVAPPGYATDPNGANDSATDVDTLTPRADLSITKSDSPDPVLAGQTLTYTIRVTNNGPSDATGVTVVDTLPPVVRYASDSCGVGSVAGGSPGGTWTWTVGDLAQGNVVTCDVIVTADAAAMGTITNPVTVTATTPDLVPGNDHASEDTLIQGLGTIAIVKQATPADGTDFPFIGDLGSFTLDDLEPVNDDDAISDTIAFTGQMPGAYTITETVLANWTLDHVNCVTDDPADTSAVHPDGVTIDLDPEEHITCTFTNIRRGSITIIKNSTPVSPTDFSFSGDLGAFVLDDAIPDDGDVFTDTITFTNLPAARSYQVTEDQPGGGYNLSRIVCDDGSSATPSTGSVDSRTVTINVDPAESVTCVFNNSVTQFVYLPLVYKQFVHAPDLVVERIIATSDQVQVVIRNQGSAAVPDDVPHGFWVDLYTNPSREPAYNETCQTIGCQGAVWGITWSGDAFSPPDPARQALPLEPGQAFTLTTGGDYYWQMFSEISWPLPAGTLIYAQVDSANADTTYGAVLENHEITGGAYNNVTGPVYSTSTASEDTVPTVVRDARARGDSELPGRP